MAHGLVLRRGNDMSLLIGIPRQPKALARLAHKLYIRLAYAALLRVTWMARPIKDKHVAADGLGGQHVRVLGHVPRAVDLAGVVDALHDAHARGSGQCMSPELSTRIVIIAVVESVCAWTATFRDIDLGNLEVVGCLCGRVRAEKYAMSCVWLIRGSSTSQI